MVTDGKAEPTATMIMEVINEWNLQDRVAALFFETAVTNISAKGGVCLWPQRILGRHLLNLTCQHHVLELVLEAVFSALVPEVSGSPGITIFQQVQRLLALRGHNRLSDSGRCHPERVMGHLCSQLLSTSPARDHLRDDCRELLELVITFIKGMPHGRQGVSLRKPGALHRERWIAGSWDYIWTKDVDLSTPVKSTSYVKALDKPCYKFRWSWRVWTRGLNTLAVFFCTPFTTFFPRTLWTFQPKVIQGQVTS